MFGLDWIPNTLLTLCSPNVSENWQKQSGNPANPTMSYTDYLSRCWIWINNSETRDVTENEAIKEKENRIVTGKPGGRDCNETWSKRCHAVATGTNRSVHLIPSRSWLLFRGCVNHSGFPLITWWELYNTEISSVTQYNCMKIRHSSLLTPSE